MLAIFATTRSWSGALVNVAQALDQGIQQLGIAVAAEALEQLAGYIGLLQRWNRVYNLTAVRRPEDMVTRHVLDSLSIAPWLHGSRVVDVGSGAGLPGIPLAIVYPRMEFTLLDSNAKRVRFMRQAVMELGLAQVSPVHCRVQDYHPAVAFDTVLARAFASLGQVLTSAGHLCACGGSVLIMKGGYPRAELDELPNAYRLKGVYPLLVPGLQAERHLLQLVPDDCANQAHG